MTRPLDDLIVLVDATIAYLRVHATRAEMLMNGEATGYRQTADVLRECRAALATAREDGAREERDRIVAWIEGDCPGLVYGPGDSILPDIVAALASGKHRPS